MVLIMGVMDVKKMIQPAWLKKLVCFFVFFLFAYYYLVQLIEHPIFRIPNFNFPNLMFFLFNIASYIGIFGCILILI